MMQGYANKVSRAGLQTGSFHERNALVKGNCQ